MLFVAGLGEKMMPGSVVGCAENMINTVVFMRFHFFTYSVNWMIPSRLLDVFLVAFWIPWSHFFSFLRVWGVSLKIIDFLGIPWKSPGLRAPGQVRVKGSSVGAVSIREVAPLRIQDTAYRIQE